jgi:hypothetical protein
MQEFGNDAGYIYRMKSLSEEFITEIVRIMKAPDTPVSTRVELIKFTAEMARLKEKPPQKNDFDAGPRGPSVVFHFGAGLPVGPMSVTPVLQQPQVLPAETSLTPVEQVGLRAKGDGDAKPGWGSLPAPRSSPAAAVETGFDIE